jgi:hypothetical protein
MKRTRVAIVVPRNAQSLDISGSFDAFLEANRLAPRPVQLRPVAAVD